MARACAIIVPLEHLLCIWAQDLLTSFQVEGLGSTSDHWKQHGSAEFDLTTNSKRGRIPAPLEIPIVGSLINVNHRQPIRIIEAHHNPRFQQFRSDGAVNQARAYPQNPG
jgi:hypothetical protein